VTRAPKQDVGRGVRRPIVGFGPGGVVAAAILVALIYAAASGFDLREELFRAVYECFDIAAVYNVLLWWIIPHGFALWQPVFGPLCLLYVLPALHVAPGLRPWWAWGTVVVTAVMVPPLWYWLFAASHFRGTFPPWVFGGDWMGFAALVNIGAVAGLWLATRSWPVAAVACGASVAGCWIAGGPWASDSVSSSVSCSWHGIMAATLLAWAIRARLRREPAGLCSACGYDLAGLAAPVCPECGAANG
jgi:hypothetical protein